MPCGNVATATAATTASWRRTLSNVPRCLRIPFETTVTLQANARLCVFTKEEEGKAEEKEEEKEEKEEEG